MTDQTPRANEPPAPANHAPPRRRLRGIVIGAVAVVAVATTAVFADRALSQGYGFGPGSWHGGPFMHGPFMHGPFARGSWDPARIEERADRMVRHLAVEVDATAEQQERLRGIVRSAVRDLVPMREKLQTGRQRVHDLLTQTTIDRAAIETFRSERMALADQASRRISQAIADAAAVLTPEQRRTIAERFHARRGYMPPWHRG